MKKLLGLLGSVYNSFTYCKKGRIGQIKRKFSSNMFNILLKFSFNLSQFPFFSLKQMNCKQTLLALGIFFFQTAYSAVPNTSRPTTFVGPTITGSYTTLPSSYSALSVAGELGVQNIRASATGAWALSENQRVKVSAEYLIQKIVYSFFSGNSGQWVTQAAFGAAYQYELAYLSKRPQFNFSAYFSHAPSINLTTIASRYQITPGVFQNFINMRRVAGSNALGFAPGFNIRVWNGGEIGADLNYDNVRYDKRYSPEQYVSGFGATGRIKQAVTENITWGFTAEGRQPFNHFQTDLVWNNLEEFKGWIFDIGASYTRGRKSLPNTYNVMFSADYIIDGQIQAFKAKNTATLNLIKETFAYRFAAWASKPAVHMPQVLAIPDQSTTLTSICSIPVIIGILPDLAGVSALTTVAAGSVFAGSPLFFSVATTPSTISSTVTISPTTGVVTITPGVDTETFTVTVTATNDCGSAVTSFGVEVEA